MASSNTVPTKSKKALKMNTCPVCQTVYNPRTYMECPACAESEERPVRTTAVVMDHDAEGNSRPLLVELDSDTTETEETETTVTYPPPRVATPDQICPECERFHARAEERDACLDAVVQALAYTGLHKEEFDAKFRLNLRTRRDKMQHYVKNFTY
jgi:hypothetical protein